MPYLNDKYKIGIDDYSISFMSINAFTILAWVGMRSAISVFMFSWFELPWMLEQLKYSVIVIAAVCFDVVLCDVSVSAEQECAVKQITSLNNNKVFQTKEYLPRLVTNFVSL